MSSLKNIFKTAMVGGLFSLLASSCLPDEYRPPEKMTKGESTLVKGFLGQNFHTNDITKHFRDWDDKNAGVEIGDTCNITFYSKEWYLPDYSAKATKSFSEQEAPSDVILHESVHLWQQRTKYAFTKGENGVYEYAITKKSRFEKDFGDEQQAAMIQDYYRRFVLGLASRNSISLGKADTKETDKMLREVVDRFFPGPKQVRLPHEKQRQQEIDALMASIAAIRPMTRR